jgi:hypothetical protein
MSRNGNSTFNPKRYLAYMHINSGTELVPIEKVRNRKCLQRRGVASPNVLR